MELHFSFQPPPIQTLVELANFLDVERWWLARAMNSSRSFYRVFQIPKRSGGHRSISAPVPSLLRVQKLIHKLILSSVVCSDRAHGFLTGRSVRSHAETHVNSKDFLLTDIENFFNSIKIEDVVSIFNRMNYSHEVASALALLCTLDGSLPQGSPTSPTLSNIYSTRLDNRLSSICSELNLSYSRYADDMVFSGDRMSLGFLGLAQSIISSEGLNLNKNKTIFAKSPSRLIITGISISNKTLKLPRETKRMLRHKAHFIVRNGIVSELARQEIVDPFYIDRIIGQLCFWSFVEPGNEFPKIYKNIIKDLISDNSL